MTANENSHRDGDPDRTLPAMDRYASFDNDGETTVIYDLRNDRAWIESTGAVRLEEMA